MTATYDLSVVVPEAPVAPAKFPSVRYGRASSFCDAYVEEFARAAGSVDWLEVDRAAEMLTQAYLRGSNVFSCGNGGSAAIANHLQCDHVKGVRTETDLSPRVVSLSSNVELLTAIANDIGYEDVFTYQMESQARPGDVLIAISSSGRSPNIVKAIEWAADHRVRTIALTGFSGGAARELADVTIHADCTNYGVIEDLHQAAMHAMAQYIRQSRMTPSAVASTTF